MDAQLVVLPENNIIVPYPQEVLGGDLGLTATEVGICLGVRSEHIRRKIKKSFLKEIDNLPEFKATHFVVVNDK